MHHESGFLRLLRLCKCSRLVERVTGDGQENVEQRVISAKRKHHKVERVEHAAVVAPTLGIDGGVHHLVPVLAS